MKFFDENYSQEIIYRTIVAYIYKQASGSVVHLTFWLVLV